MHETHAHQVTSQATQQCYTNIKTLTKLQTDMQIIIKKSDKTNKLIKMEYNRNTIGIGIQHRSIESSPIHTQLHYTNLNKTTNHTIN